MMFKSEESITRNQSTSKESRLNKSDSVRREGGRKTTADVLEGFAPGLAKGGRRLLPTPVPLFVYSVDFRGFCVGDGGGYYMGSIQPFFLFSVFLCDFCVFRVMMRPSKKNPVHETEVHPKIHNSNPGFT